MDSKTTGFENELVQNIGVPHQRALTLAFVALGMGNLMLPASFKAILPLDYLLLCLAVFATTILFNLHRVLRVRGILHAVFYLALAIIPGFVVGTVTSYGQDKLIAFVILFLLLGAFAAVRGVTWMSRALVLSFSAVSLLTCLLALAFGETGLGGRTVIWDLNPIGIGRATGLLGAVCLTGLLASGRVAFGFRLAMLCGALLSAAATVSTGSRGPLLSAGLACILAYVALIVRDGVSKSKSALFGGAAAMSAIAFVVLTGTENAGLTRIQEGGDSGRFSLLSETWRVVAEHPLGIGWGNYAYYVHGFAANDGILYPHNIFVEFLVEGGILGLLGFLIIIVIGLRRAFRLHKTTHTYGLILLSLLVYSLANAQLSSDIVGNRMMWVFLAAAIVLGAPQSTEKGLRKNTTAESTLARGN